MREPVGSFQNCSPMPVELCILRAEGQWQRKCSLHHSFPYLVLTRSTLAERKTRREGQLAPPDCPSVAE